MRIAQVNLEEAAVWVYPTAFPDIPRPTALSLPEPSKLAELWKIINPSGSDTSIFRVHHLSEKAKGRRREDDSLVCIRSQFIQDLASINVNERWRIAELWCGLRLKTKCNREQAAQHKDLFNALCDLAQHSVATSTAMAVIQDTVVED